MSYSARISDLSRRAAFFVDRILKGTKPSELPIEQPTTFELVLNLKESEGSQTRRSYAASSPPTR
jgi:putative ABC transport system substrate-binding protein